MKFLKKQDWTDSNVARLKRILEIATDRSQTGEISENEIREAWSASFVRDRVHHSSEEFETLVKKFSHSGNSLKAMEYIFTNYHSFDNSTLAAACQLVFTAITKKGSQKGVIQDIADNLGEK
ncbi:MAG: hypothetical protein ACE5FW_02745, partial [Candidatus Aenigmatarchaeota archaeon]